MQKEYDFISRNEPFAQALIMSLNMKKSSRNTFSSIVFEQNEIIEKEEPLCEELSVLEEIINFGNEEQCELIKKKIEKLSLKNNSEFKKDILWKILTNTIESNKCTPKNSDIVNFDMLFNQNIQAIVWQSLITLASLEKSSSYPLAKMLIFILNDSEEISQNSEYDWIQYLNTDIVLFNFVDVSAKKKSKYKFLHCPKCEKIFWVGKDQQNVSCAFDKKHSKLKKSSKKKYMKFILKRNKKEIILNSFSKESFVGSKKEENLVAFRVLNMFKYCLLLGLSILNEDRFEAVFKLQRVLKKQHKLSLSPREYLLFQIENEVDYLKRIYCLRFRPFEAIRKLFAKFGKIMANSNSLWDDFDQQERFDIENQEQEKILIEDLDAYSKNNEILLDRIRKNMQGFQDDAKKSKQKFDQIFDEMEERSLMMQTIVIGSNSLFGNSVKTIKRDFTSLFTGALEEQYEMNLINVKESLIINEDSQKNRFLKYFFENRYWMEGPINDLFYTCLNFGVEVGSTLEHEHALEDLRDVSLAKYVNQFGVSIREREFDTINQILQNWEKKNKQENDNQGEKLRIMYFRFKLWIGQICKHQEYDLFEKVMDSLQIKEKSTKEDDSEYDSDCSSEDEQEEENKETENAENESKKKANNVKTQSAEKSDQDEDQEEISQSEKASVSEEASESEKDSHSESASQSEEENFEQIKETPTEKNDGQKKDAKFNLFQYQTNRKNILENLKETDPIPLDRNTLSKINTKNKWKLEHILINNTYKSTSIIMKICSSIGKFQNKLIEDFYLNYLDKNTKETQYKNKKKYRINLYGIKREDIIHCPPELFKEAYNFAGKYHCQSQETLLNDMENFLIDRIFKDLPMLKEKLTKEYEFSSTENIYLSESQINYLKRKIEFEFMPVSQLTKFRSELEKSEEIKPDLHHLVRQLVVKCMVMKDQIDQNATIKDLIKRFFMKESIVTKMSKNVGKLILQFPLKYLLHLFEEVELAMFQYHQQNPVFELTEVEESDVKKLTRDSCEKSKNILTRGLKQLAGRIVHLPDIHKKSIADLLSDFEYLFRHSEYDTVQAKLIQISKMKKKGNWTFGFLKGESIVIYVLLLCLFRLKPPVI